MSQLGRRKFLLYSSTGVLASLLLKGCADSGGGDTTADSTANPCAAAGGDGIKVGILHSLSGTMAISETTVVDAEMLAIDEINAAGGVLGKQIIPIQEDGASDWPTFAEKAAKLIDQDQVVTVFG